MIDIGGAISGAFGGSLGGGAASTALAFLGDAAGLAGQNYYNKKAASKDRQFQRWVLRNKHQQIAKDMEDAGLNRILAIPDSGAMPSPSGIGVAMPQVGATAQRLAGARESEEKAKQAASQTELNKANEDLAREAAEKATAEIQLINQQTRLTGAEADKQEVLKRIYTVIAPSLERMTDAAGDLIEFGLDNFEKFIKETGTDPTMIDNASMWIGDFIDYMTRTRSADSGKTRRERRNNHGN